MPAPLNDTRPHFQAHTMPHATSPTAVSDHQTTLCLLTFHSHRIRPSSMPTKPPASASKGTLGIYRHFTLTSISKCTKKDTYNVFFFPRMYNVFL